jgi:hypothetical protein
MKKNIFILLVFFLLTIKVQAEYVLPYPSYMPGNKLYTISRITDRLQEYWHWGNIAKSNYFLSQSDKKLVEAKTLFEYKQYLLAVDALKRSDDAFQKVPPFLESAFRNGEDIQERVKNFHEASNEHEEVLKKLIIEVPAEFTWTPEKTDATTLKINDLLETAENIRSSASLTLRSFDLCTRSISSTQEHERLYKSCQEGKKSFEQLIKLEDLQ